MNVLKRILFHPVPLAVARSLRDDADSWEVSNCTLSHKSGVTLWIGNLAYGMQVYSDKARTQSVWGGVTFRSTFGLSPSHHLLRRSADRWLRSAGGDVVAMLGVSL